MKNNIVIIIFEEKVIQLDKNFITNPKSLWGFLSLVPLLGLGLREENYHLRRSGRVSGSGFEYF